MASPSDSAWLGGPPEEGGARPDRGKEGDDAMRIPAAREGNAGDGGGIVAWRRRPREGLPMSSGPTPGLEEQAHANNDEQQVEKK